MAEINLLQTKQEGGLGIGGLSQSTSWVGFWIIVGLLVIEMSIYTGFFLWHTKVSGQVSTVQSEITQLDQQLQKKKLDTEKVVKVQASLANLSNLLDKHVHWSQVFRDLGSVTLKTISFSDVDATSDKNRFIISGEVPNFTELGKILYALHYSDNFKSINLLTSGKGKGEKVTVAFDIEVIIKPELLLTDKTSLTTTTSTKP